MKFLLSLSILTALLGYTAGEYYSKQWALSHDFSDAIKAFGTYSCSTVAWIGIMYHYREIFVASVLWELSCVLIAGFIGLYLFKERPSNTQLAGAFLGLISIFMLLRGK